MMLKYKIIIMLLVSVLILTQVNALTTNGSDKTFSYTVTSNTNNNPSSENFKNYLVVGNINEDMSSSNFKTTTGFSITAPFLDSEACEVDSECVGGFCCSNSCQSTACSTTTTTTTTTGGGGGAAGGGGGGGVGAGAAPVYECSQDSDCGENKYCFDNVCHDAECFDDSVCNIEEGESCWNYRCVKLFDIVILDFESPVKLGEFFDFTYFIKGVADINDDVEIGFWIEQNGNVVTSGSDTIYMGSFEEKTKTTKLFLPSDVASGTYEFIIQINYGTYTVSAHRTIEIIVSEEGIATITPLPEIEITDYIIYVLIGFAVFIIFLIFYMERKNIKAGIVKEEKWIKKHKVSILILFLFIILGVLIYHFKWYRLIADWTPKIVLWSKTYLLPNLSSILKIISILVLLIIILGIVREKRWLAQFRKWKKRARDLRVKRRHELQKRQLRLKEERENLKLKLRLEKQRQRELEEKREKEKKKRKRL